MAFMRQLLETAKKYDITICLENMPFLNFSIGSPSEILEFVQKMNDERFKICLDTGHVAVYEGLDVADVIRELSGEIRVLHLHDNDGKSDLHMLPNRGVINWREVGRALRDIGFEGVYSYETAKPEGMAESEYYQSLAEIAYENF